MPVQDIDRNGQWNLDLPDQTWTLTANATIFSMDDYGIEDTTTGSRVRVLGSVLGDGGSVAVKLGSAASTLTVGVEGWLSGFSRGVEMHENGGIVVNRGLIEASLYGVNGTRGVVENYGTIQGETGVSFVGGGFVVENHGSIQGYHGVFSNGAGGTIINSAGAEILGQTAIYLQGTGFTRIVNDGMILGRDRAIYSEAEVNIVNHGSIIGDLALSTAADRIDTRGGTVRGVIYGGDGDDLYLVSSIDIRIDDAGSSFSDTVKSTASFALSSGLDDLFLIGKKDIDGAGNAGANIMRGNAGQNILSGNEGSDSLSGGRGNDLMNGGGGADEFVYDKGFGRDIINDFEDGLDRIDASEVGSRRDFNDLEIRQVSDNIAIDFGGGDTLTIFDMQKADLTYADFRAAS